MPSLANILTLATAATALALPKDLVRRADTPYTDTFDDLRTSIVTPQLFPVGVYHGLSYGGVVVLVSALENVKPTNDRLTSY